LRKIDIKSDNSFKWSFIIGCVVKFGTNILDKFKVTYKLVNYRFEFQRLRIVVVFWNEGIALLVDRLSTLFGDETQI